MGSAMFRLRRRGLAAALFAGLALAACAAPAPPSCTGDGRQPVNPGIADVR